MQKNQAPLLCKKDPNMEKNEEEIGHPYQQIIHSKKMKTSWQEPQTQQLLYQNRAWPCNTHIYSVQVKDRSLHYIWVTQWYRLNLTTAPHTNANISLYQHSFEHLIRTRHCQKLLLRYQIWSSLSHMQKNSQDLTLQRNHNLDPKNAQWKSSNS